VAEDFKNFISVCAREYGIDQREVAKFFERAVRVAAQRYFPKEYAESLRYDIDKGEIVDNSGQIIAIKTIFGLGGIKLLQESFTKEIRKFAMEKDVKELQQAKSKLIIAKVKGKDRFRVFLTYKSLELILPKEEQIFGEEYVIGNIYKVVVLKVTKVKDDWQIIVSRASNDLVVELMKSEIPEIAEGKIEIVSVVREAGYRSKVVVKGRVAGLDVIGSCMGIRNTRISNISSQLNGEHIDVILYQPDMKEFIKAALKPATIQEVILFPAEKRAEVIVSENEVGVCLGKNGQNVRLATRLTGWFIDVKRR
jgi:N utilization substance protein A